MEKRIWNKKYAEENRSFRDAFAKVFSSKSPTKRQASKFRNQEGLIFKSVTSQKPVSPRRIFKDDPIYKALRIKADVLQKSIPKEGSSHA